MNMERQAVGTAIFVWSTLLMLLTGCSDMMGKMSGTDSPPQKMYIDATRNFAVEFPGDWEKFLDPDSDTLPGADAVGWQSPKAENSVAVARMLVIIPHEYLDFAEAREEITRQLENFSSEKEESITVARLEGIDMHGETAERRYRMVLLGKPFVRYILVYSALPDHFKRDHDQFKDMIKSFEPLR